jgi:hypothetical protein
MSSVINDMIEVAIGPYKKKIKKQRAEIERLKSPRKRMPTRVISDKYGLGYLECLAIEDAFAANWGIELE